MGTSRAKAITSEADMVHAYFFPVVLMVAIYLLSISLAYAAGTPMGDVLCEVVNWMQGNLGKGLATIAICVIGIGACLGKASWGLALTVGVGISVLFNAAEIVDKLGIGLANC